MYVTGALLAWCVLASVLSHLFGGPPAGSAMQGTDQRSGLRWEITEAGRPLVVLSAEDHRASARLELKRPFDFGTEEIPLRPAYVAALPEGLRGTFLLKVCYGDGGLKWSGDLRCPHAGGLLWLEEGEDQLRSVR